MKSQPDTRDQLERAMTLLRRSRSFWRRALVVFLVGICIVVPYVFTRPRAYRSETVILYQETIRSTDLTGGDGSGESARRAGARLREVLLSRASLEPIITDLHLYSKRGQTLDRAGLVEAVDDMRRSITFRQREGDTFEIAYVGSIPTEVQEVTRRLGECLIQEAANRRAEQAKALKEFLQAENERNKADLKLKEAELAKFTALNPGLAARLQGLPPQTGTGSAPSGGGDPVLAVLEARAYRLERQLRAVNNELPLPPPPKVKFQPPPDSPELVAARKDLADKLARYTDKHPDVTTARARLRVAEAAQAATNETAREAFMAKQVQDDVPPPKDEAAIRKELADLYGRIGARKLPSPVGDGGSSVAAVPLVSTNPEVALEVEFRRLQREVNEVRDRQHELDAKLFKASITANSVMNDRNIQVSVLDPAFLPGAPVTKPRSFLLGGLLVLCFLLAFATALASAVADDRLYDRIDVERLDVMPVVGVIPRAQLASKR
jgi:uncharacterized protein involved in exopolysaccharide biosynthesis